MNKFFTVITLIICFLNILYFNLKDVLMFPDTEPPEYIFLKNFNKEYPDIKEAGFYSNIENPVYVLYRIQNSIIPAVIKDSVDADYVFCYSPDGLCGQFIMNGYAKLVKAYSNELLLLTKPKEEVK